MFFGCYLLTSQNGEFKGHTYIGFTVNPIRRLKQHNGQITGGAFKTFRKRPWEMVLIVQGFPNKFTALQFEWAWQNPHSSRHFKGTDSQWSKHNYRNLYLPRKLDALAEMLAFPCWSRCPLKVHFLSQKYREMYHEKNRTIPPHIATTEGSLEILSSHFSNAAEQDILEDDSEDEFLGDEYEITCEDLSSQSCEVCRKKFHSDEIDIVRCLKGAKRNNHDCMYSHTLCLSKHFLSKESTPEARKMLIPLGGPCPRCHKTLVWGDLIMDFVARTSKGGRASVTTAPQGEGSKPKPKPRKKAAGTSSSQLAASQSLSQSLSQPEDPPAMASQGVSSSQSAPSGTAKAKSKTASAKRARGAEVPKNPPTGSGGGVEKPAGLPPKPQAKGKTAEKRGNPSTRGRYRKVSVAPASSHNPDVWSSGLKASMEWSSLTLSASDSEDLPAVLARTSDSDLGPQSDDSQSDTEDLGIQRSSPAPQPVGSTTPKWKRPPTKRPTAFSSPHGVLSDHDNPGLGSEDEDEGNFYVSLSQRILGRKKGPQ